jgi:hypothetical protein
MQKWRKDGGKIFFGGEPGEVLAMYSGENSGKNIWRRTLRRKRREEPPSGFHFRLPLPTYPPTLAPALEHCLLLY